MFCEKKKEKEKTKKQHLPRKTLDQQWERLFSCTEQQPSQQQANVHETEEEIAVLLEIKSEKLSLFVKVHQDNQLFVKGLDTGGL